MLASAISAWTYAKRKNLDVKNGVVLLLSILVFTLVGSYIGQFAPNTIVKYFAIFMVCTIGLKFIIWPVMTSKTEMGQHPLRPACRQVHLLRRHHRLHLRLCGRGRRRHDAAGADPGAGLRAETAIGTSVFIMSFTALFGAVSHFVLGAKPNLWVMFLCIATTLIAAEISAVFANNASLKKLNKAVGVCLLIFAVVLILLNVFGKTA